MSNLLTPPAVVAWLDAKRVFHQFTLGRSVLARLEREGKISSCSLADVGKARGKKLYNVQSIHDFLNSRANAGKVEAQ
jgi:hypothetical protein